MKLRQLFPLREEARRWGEHRNTPCAWAVWNPDAVTKGRGWGSPCDAAPPIVQWR
jgi:hypothetical protein